MGFFGFAHSICCKLEVVKDTSNAIALWSKLKKPSSRFVTKNEMVARIANVYFRTLYFTSTEFPLVHPDNLVKSIFFY